MTATALQVGVIDYQDAAREFGPWATAGTYRVFHSGAVEAIRAFLDGRPIRLLGS